MAVYGSWHLGQLQVGLSRAVRLRQASSVTVRSSVPLPMQVDGEPWVQAPATLRVAQAGQALMLRKVESKPLARLVQAVAEVLDRGERTGAITTRQHRQLTTELAARLQPLLQSA